jgi:hypothetical protein
MGYKSSLMTKDTSVFVPWRDCHIIHSVEGAYLQTSVWMQGSVEAIQRKPSSCCKLIAELNRSQKTPVFNGRVFREHVRPYLSRPTIISCLAH